MKSYPVKPVVLFLTFLLSVCSVLGTVRPIGGEGLSTACCDCSADTSWYPIPGECSHTDAGSTTCSGGSCGTGSCSCIASAPNCEHIPLVLPSKESPSFATDQCFVCAVPQQIETPKITDHTNLKTLKQPPANDPHLSSTLSTRAPPV